ncbi:WG repeat-containing protein [Paenibacillus sp. FSL W8-0194]|uniref:WG repeat-containing protein n=1 Tax=Paenibacillus sp. FSL W8-0194 TaxID=2921711 RepID=UPI0030DB99C3
MDYFPFNEGEQWGYIGREWDVLIPPIFEEADYFSDGLAAVLKNGLWGYIDMGGNVIIDYQFQSAERFVEGKAWVMAEEKFTLLNKKGDVLNQLPKGIADHIDGLSSNLYRFSREDKFGFLGPDGELRLDAVYDEASSFIDGIALVSREGKSYFINTGGSVILESPKYRPVEGFSEGLAQVLFENRQYGYINTEGEVTIPPSMRIGSRFSEGMAFFFDPQTMKYGYMNTTGDTLIVAKYDAALPFIRGLALVKKGKQVELINDRGEMVYPLPKESNVDVESYLQGAGYFMVNVNGEEKLFNRELGEMR